MDKLGVLNDAMVDHATLHYRVNEYAKKPDRSLKAADLQVDDACDLGRWLSTDGAVHQFLPEHAALKDAHTAFHRATADTVRHADAGTLPEGWLGEKGALKTSLAHLFVAIGKMNFKVG